MSSYSGRAYPHLIFTSGTRPWGVAPELLARLDALGQRIGKQIRIESGYRSDADQARTCAQAAPGVPCAAPGTSSHRYGIAADAYIGNTGTTLYTYLGGSAKKLAAAGLWPLPGDKPHVELAAADGSRLREKLSSSELARLALGHAGQSGSGLAGSANVGTTGGGLATITPGGLTGALGLGDVAPSIADAGGDLATGIAKEIVDSLVSALGDTGARVLVTGGLVAAGVALMGVGTARALGVSAKAGQAKEQAAGAAELAVQARTGGAAAGATKAAGGALA